MKKHACSLAYGILIGAVASCTGLGLGLVLGAVIDGGETLRLCLAP